MDLNTQAMVRTAQMWLQSSWNVQVPLTWLEACVEWIKEEGFGRALPKQRINQQHHNETSLQVLDQWLLADLRDLANPALPGGLQQRQQVKLNGSFCVQVDSVLDISQGAYGQLQQFRGTDSTNEGVSAVTQTNSSSGDSKSTRMLLLQITDGVQNLEAMEYRPIPAFNTSMRPGVKLQLKGQIVCRLGVMLLGPENVVVLGGEVENLSERHNQGRVLSRALGLPEEADSNQHDGLQPRPVPQTAIDEPMFEDTSNISQQSGQESRLRVMMGGAPRKTQPTNTIPFNTSHGFGQPLRSEGKEIVSVRNKPESDSKVHAESLNPPPFTYLCLVEDWFSEHVKEIRVKAFIVTLLGKMTSSTGTWHIGATISDGTAYLDVEVSNHVLTGLLGFSVADKIALKQDPSRRGELSAGMKRCQEGLVDMCCVMTIALEQQGRKAVVTDASLPTDDDWEALQKRMRQGTRPM
ncbi:recQ-mediated genome instability protein 1 [Aplochiton taeniatus]